MRLNKYAAGLLAGVFAVGTTAPAFADTVTGNANAEIIEDLEVTEAQQMEFYQVTRPSTGEGPWDYVLLADGTFTDPPGGFQTGGTPLVASFDVAGAANETYTVSLPGGAQVCTDGETRLRDFTDNAGGTLDGTGADSFDVGATLRVFDTSPLGDVDCNFDVTVNYT